MTELIYETVEEIEEQKIEEAKMIMKELRVSVWEQTGVVSRIIDLVDDVNHKLIVS